MIVRLLEVTEHARLDESARQTGVWLEASLETGPALGPGHARAHPAESGECRRVGGDRALPPVEHQKQDVGAHLGGGHESDGFVTQEVGGVELEGGGLPGARILLAFHRGGGIIHSDLLLGTEGWLQGLRIHSEPLLLCLF